MDKRGEERIFTVWWFIVIVLVAGVVVLATLGFFSKETDTKEYEAGILYERIMECLVQNGKLRADFNSGFDIYKECGLQKEVFLENSSFYFEINLNKNLVLQGGDNSKKADCSIKQGVEAKNFPGCINQTEVVLYYMNGELNNATIQVLTASEQDALAFMGGTSNG